MHACAGEPPKFREDDDIVYGGYEAVKEEFDTHDDVQSKWEADVRARLCGRIARVHAHACRVWEAKSR
jgi:hypothetical protein